MNAQIEQFIEGIRQENSGTVKRKISALSDDMAMDTSDEMEANVIDLQNLFSVEGVMNSSQDEEVANRNYMVEEQADQVIKDAERSKARLYEVPGKLVGKSSQNVLAMDLDYQMIDAHIDNQTRRKIQCFEYVNFSKLISRS